MNRLLSYFIDRFKEPSTWRACIWLATSFGLLISPEQTEAIIAVGTLLVGGVGFITPDQLQKTESS